MKKSITVFLCLIASAALLLGLIIFFIAIAANGWKFSSDAVENSYEYEEKITDISILGSTEDVIFLPSQDGKTKFVFTETETLKHSVAYDNGKTSVSVVDTRKWYNHIFNFTDEKITVYLPEGLYSSLKIDVSTGDVKIAKNFSFDFIDISLSTGDVDSFASANVSTKIELSTGKIRLQDSKTGELTLKSSTGDMMLKNIEAENVSIKVSTGDVTMDTVFCKSLSTTGSTGDLYLTDVIASGNWYIKRDTGRVEFSDSDASEIYIETDTGDVRGSLLSEKIFFHSSDTGDVKLPQTMTGGKCEIKTDTGDIKITISKN